MAIDSFMSKLSVSQVKLLSTASVAGLSSTAINALASDRIAACLPGSSLS